MGSLIRTVSMQNSTSLQLLFIELTSYILSPVLLQLNSHAAVSMGQTASEHQQLPSAEDNHQHTDGQAAGPGKVRIMSQLHQLEDLYNQRIKIDENEQKRYQGLLKYVVDEMISKIKETTPEFADLYRETYYGGSFVDVLKIGLTEQEFDLNIIFKWKAQHGEITRLVEDQKKKNFCYIKVTKPVITPSEEKITFSDQGVKYLSPIKMFNMIKKSVDRVLTEISLTVKFEGKTYRVTRHEYAPVTLKVVGNGMSFEVDLVPSIKFDFKTLPEDSELKRHVVPLCDEFGVAEETRNFMAISLHRADKEKFELDFHDVERRILYNRGCVKKVIKLMKYLRDLKGGPMLKLWSHLLKTSVMHQVLLKPKTYWNNENLVTCFMDSLRNLLEGLRRKSITDVFFPHVNLLDRIKKQQVIQDNIGQLDRIVRRFDREGEVMDVFK